MKYAFISQNADIEIKNFISSVGKNIIQIIETDSVYQEISDHPDIYLCTLENTIILAKEQISNIFMQLHPHEEPTFQQVSSDEKSNDELSQKNLDFYIDTLNKTLSPVRVLPGSSEVGQKYPHSCIYNGITIGTHFLHNVAYTDKALLKVVNDSKYKILNVMQGYTNCNIVTVDETSIITSDSGIARSIRESAPEIDVLSVSPGFVQLKGFAHGFLGGTSGKIDDYIIFNGNLKAHPDFEAIKRFIETRNLKLKYFENYPLTDIGSILTV